MTEHLKTVFRKKSILLAAMLFFVAAGSMGIWGCGTGGYDVPSSSAPAPVLTQTDNALIDAATLKGWMDQGLVNATSGEKVVVLDLTTQALYDAGHIPGAVRVDSSELTQTRIEAVAEMPMMVVDGAIMDAIIQRAGINEYTTIVCTSNSLSSATRLYTNFRYWGFPRNRIKVLNGIDGDWTATYPTVVSIVTPVITPSTYCVTPKGINRVRADLRVSLGEMMDVVRNYDGTKQVIIDDLSNPANGLATPVTSTSTWTNNNYKGIPGSTTGLFPAADAAVKEYVVFEGHMKNAVNVPYSSLYSSNKYYPADDGTAVSLKSKLNAVGMDATKTAYIHCRAGNAATIEFFAVDGILKWNAVWYDGSWGQWGSMADKKGGKLKAGSIWSTYSLSVSDPVPNCTDTGLPKYVRDAVDGVTYNIDNAPVGSNTPFAIQPLHYDQSLDTVTSVTDPAANQIEETDKAYISPNSAPASGGSSGGGSSSGGGC